MRRFLCGCDLPSAEALLGDPELKTLAVCSYDEDGFLICQLHHQRRYGWRSLPEIQTPNGRRADYSFASLTPWQIEQVVLFGADKEYLISKAALMEIHFFPDDRRDNRDPEAVAEEHVFNKHGAFQRNGGGFLSGVVGMPETLKGVSKLSDPSPRFPCQVCGNHFRTKKDGTLQGHLFNKEHCPGSGLRPASSFQPWPKDTEAGRSLLEYQREIGPGV